MLYYGELIGPSLPVETSGYTGSRGVGKYHHGDTHVSVVASGSEAFTAGGAGAGWR